MSFLTLLFLASIKVSLDLFSYLDVKTREYQYLFRPDVVGNFNFNWIRVYFDVGYPTTGGKYTSERELKIYQAYLKFQGNFWESKIGKILFVPGFPGLFNPFYTNFNFETIGTSWQGERGVLLRASTQVASPSAFITFEKSLKSPEITLQLTKGIGAFELGLYSRCNNSLKPGIFAGYYGKFTSKIQALKQDSVIKMLGQLEFKFFNALPSLWFYYSSSREFFSLLSYPVFSGKILALEFKFPDKVFEIPYILLLCDLDGKGSVALFDIRFPIKNMLTLESGILFSFKDVVKQTIFYGGIKLVKGF